MLVDPLGSSYPTPESLLQFFDQVEAEVRAVPGVADVAWASALPLGDSLRRCDADATRSSAIRRSTTRSGRPTDFQIVSPTLLLDARPADRRRPRVRRARHRDSPPVCIVNEAFVRSISAAASPIGMRVAFKVAGSPQEPSRTCARSSAWRGR